MNWLQIVPYIIQLVQAIPDIQKAWESSPNGLQAVSAVVQKTPIASALADMGAQMFPKLSPELHAAAAALVVAHPNNTSWIQSSLNLLQSTGYVNFGAPLVVDGLYGPKTRAAVESVETKLGIPAVGMVTDALYSELDSLISKAAG